ncbi:hypothetical protein [Prauserella muralis]|nr:hypothetical protein [Prauserella muralis]TWE27486.1 hypothetical protein FHX69_0119 [Prauserella muralis]
MSQWSWVLLGYGVALVAIAGYVASLVRRWVRVRRRAGERP